MSIEIDTIADHVRERYTVTAWCPKCSRVETINLQRLVDEGRGDQPFSAIAKSFRCEKCGGPGRITRKPPDRVYLLDS